MVFKKHRKIRSRSRTFFMKRSRSRSKGSSNPMGLLIGAAIYGAARQKIATAILPITNKIPFGNISDEILLGTAAYIGVKKTKGIVQNIARAALTIEAARLGDAVISGQVGIGSQTGSSSSW